MGKDIIIIYIICNIIDDALIPFVKTINKTTTHLYVEQEQLVHHNILFKV